MRSIFIHIIILLFATNTSAQTIVEVVKIEKDNGLHDRIVDRVIRDQQGYFILLMLNTMQRYDGNVFEDIECAVIKNKGYKVRDVDHVDMLSDGTIIFNLPTSDELYYLPNRQNTIKSKQKEGQPIVHKGDLYLALNNQLYKTNFISSSRELISEQSIPNDIITLAKINDVYYLQDKNFNNYILSDDKIANLDISGKLVQRSNGVYVFGDRQISKLTGKKITKVSDLSERYHKCSVLKIDKEENIIGAYQSRPMRHDKLYVLDKNDSLHLMSSIGANSSIYKDFHTDNAFDRWIMVGYNSIDIINLLRDGARIINTKSEATKTAFGGVMTGIGAHNDQEIIYAKEEQGLYRYNRLKDINTEIFVEKRVAGDLDRNSKLYYHPGSNAYYLHGYRYDGKSNVYRIDHLNQTMRENIVPFKLNDIHVESNNNILLGGYIDNSDQGMLGRFDFELEKYAFILKLSTRIRSIDFDKKTQNYWIGTEAGLYVFDTNFNQLAVLDKTKKGSNKMLNDHIRMSTRYNDVIVAGTYSGGVYFINPETYDIIKQLDVKGGLTDNAAVGIISDDVGNCWITTFNGVNVIDENLNIIKKIYQHEGLPNREFNSKAITKDGNGIIYSGTLNGVSMLEPLKVLEWKKHFGVDITEILAYNGEYTDKLEYTDHLTLTTSYDSLKVSYRMTDYNIYPYVTERVDVSVDGTSLEIIQKNNSIIIKGIKLGSSTIRLQGRKSSLSQTLNITRKLDYLFYSKFLLGLLFLSLLIWYIAKRYISTNKSREEEKTRLNKKISDLQLSSLQSQMNPHFIFNALGAVQYFIQTHDTDRADDYLSDFAMLMRSILESSKSKFIRLSEELRLLELYVHIESVRFDGLFEYNIKVDVNVDTEINLPPMIIQPFVENAINHGLFNLKNKNGKLTIHFAMPIEDKLIVTITDNGIGRKKAAEVRMKKHKPRGMQLVQERLETLNNSAEIRIRTETIDLEENGIAKGTKVIVTVES